MFLNLKNSVARVQSINNKTAGTAFFCFPKGLLITCTHVLELGGIYNLNNIIKLEFRPDTVTDEVIEVEAVICKDLTRPSKKEDITVLRITNGNISEARPLYFRLGKPSLGALFDSFGYPDQNPIYGMPGYGNLIGLTQEPFGGIESFIINSEEITQGFSGGPCVSRETGEVLGVVCATTTANKSNKGGKGVFVVPTEVIKKICPSIEVGIPEIINDLNNSWKNLRGAFKKYSLLLDNNSFQDDIFEPPVLHFIDNTKSFPSIEFITFQEAIVSTINEASPHVNLIVGTPGTGKTKLLTELANTLWDNYNLYNLAEPIVPILLTASSYINAQGSSSYERIAQALKSDRTLRSKVLNEKTIEDLLSGGRFRCAILIDALDEIVDRTERKRFISDLKYDSKTLFLNNHILFVSSRPLDVLSNEDIKRLTKKYLLPLMSPAIANELSLKLLGNKYNDFQKTIKTSGLSTYLDTPLLINLAAMLFSKNTTNFPKDILSLYQQFLFELCKDWKKTESPEHEKTIIESLGHIALATLEGKIQSQSENQHWLYDTDKSLQVIFEKFIIKEPEVNIALQKSQKILNFVFEKSGLLSKDLDTISWQHLLLRDYLAASSLGDKRNFDCTKKILIEYYDEPIWREALILVIVIYSFEGLADDLLLDICKKENSENGFSKFLTIFIKDSILRGAVFSNDFLEKYFQSFKIYALEEQRLFGSCEGALNNDYGMFWHLLVFQCIPEAQRAIQEAVQNANSKSVISEWPNSERSKTFTPEILYAGRMATINPIFKGTSINSISENWLS